MMFSSAKNTAKRRYLRDSFFVMLAYMAFVVASRAMVNRWHPVGGWPLFAIAALPTAPLLCFAYVVGRYLRDERDDYQRDIVIRGMLWGAAVALSVSIFADFLRAYGWAGSLPPFSEFMLFWITVAIVKVVNRVTEGFSRDE